MAAVIILLLIVGFIGFWCLVGWLAIGTSVAASRQSKRELANARAIVDQLFNGAPQVVYAPRSLSGGLPTPVLIQGATQRGYRFVSETGQMAARTVVFTKV